MARPTLPQSLAIAILVMATGLAAFAVAHRQVPPPQAVATPRPAPPPQPTPTPAPTPEPLVVKRVLPLGPLKFGEHHWDEAGVPDGPVVITVDLGAQVLSVFRGGYEIGATAILFGDTDKPTPLGRFPITQKDADHVSNLYGAPMPYMLRLTDDGISVHGTKVEWGYATHGCIGVPVPFAKRLFAAAKLGDVVIVTQGKALSVGESITG